MADYLGYGSDDGMIFGASTTALLAFWGATPVDQPDCLTTALTTITASANSPCSASTTTSMDWTACGAGVGAGFAASAQFYTMMLVVQNLQTRVAELEARAEELGIVAAN